MDMRFEPANIRLIHRRCRSADQLTESQRTDTKGLKYEHLTTVSPYQSPSVYLSPEASSDCDALDFIERDFVSGLVVEFGDGGAKGLRYWRRLGGNRDGWRVRI